MINWADSADVPGSPVVHTRAMPLIVANKTEYDDTTETGTEDNDRDGDGDDEIDTDPSDSPTQVSSGNSSIAHLIR